MTGDASRRGLRPAAVMVVTVMVVLAVLAGSGTGASARLHAATPTHNLVGPWAIEAVWDAGIGAERWVGVMQFAENGTCSARVIANVLGALPHPHESLSCTYSVGGDGMGRWTLDFGDGPISAAFVVAGRWTQMRMLLTEPTGVNGTGEAIRQ